MQNMPIGIFRGDDTDAFSYQTIVGTINTDLDLTGCKAVFKYLSFSVEFDPIPEDKKLTVIIPASETSKFPPGLGYASLRVYDSKGKLCTFSNRIMVFVATKTPMFGNEEFEVDFNVRPELEPLKIFVGPNAEDFDQYNGFVSKIIDRASLVKYGLAILADAMSEDGGASGKAASPLAVKAAYDAIIKELTDNYYTAEETDEAIDRVAAYYITSDAAGHPFQTHAALINAQTYYSGGEVRTPTRNDYAVVLADEEQQGAEWRYIYAVAEGQTVGQWEPQYPIEGVMTIDQSVTKDSPNPVSGGGVWSAIWGALDALPGFSSIYDWCVAQLAGKVPTSRKVNGKALSSDVTLTGADIAVSGTDSTKINATLAGKASTADATLTERGFSEWNVVCSDPTVHGVVVYDSNYQKYMLYDSDILDWLFDETEAIWPEDSATSLQFNYPDDDLTFVATREALPGYILGPDDPSNPNRDKPLASEAEAEALRTGKADKPATFTAGNLAEFDSQGNPTDSGKKPSDFQSALSNGQLANIAAVSDALAFDATHSYAAGDPVVYNGTLYTFTTAHTGAWTGSDVSAVDIIARLAGKLDKSGDTMTGSLHMGDNFLKWRYGNLIYWLSTNGLYIWDDGDDETHSPGYTIEFPLANETFALIQHIAPDYYGETSHTYAVNELRAYQGAIYRCTTAHTATSWVAANWALATVEDVLAALRTGKADVSAIPYSLGTPTVIDSASSEVVEGETVNYGAATLANRTANIVQVTAATALDELRITFPAATIGKVRDFGLRVEIGTGSAALTAPALVPIAPTGETIKLENADGAIPELADGTATAKGVTLLYFSETAPGVFVVKGEQVEEVA